jgi:hypothetical protein
VDDDTRPIGSDPAWEPAPAPGPPETAASGAADPAAEPAADPAVDSAPAAERTSRASRWRFRLIGTPGRRRGALAGAAVGLVAVSGLGGFAIGHAAADDSGRLGDRGQVDARFRDRDGDGHGFPGGVPPQGSEGLVPSPPGGDGDRDFDGPGDDTGNGTGSGTGNETQPGSRT